MHCLTHTGLVARQHPHKFNVLTKLCSLMFTDLQLGLPTKRNYLKCIDFVLTCFSLKLLLIMFEHLPQTFYKFFNESRLVYIYNGVH